MKSELEKKLDEMGVTEENRKALTPVTAYAFVEGSILPWREKHDHVLVLKGAVDLNQREYARSSIKDDLGATHVWFEDECGTDKDMSRLLPKR